MTAMPAKVFWVVVHQNAPNLPGMMRVDINWEHHNHFKVDLPLQWFLGVLILHTFFGRN